MSESSFKLRERTTLLAGESHGISQSIALSMTEHGSDVGIICKSAQTTQRFVSNLMDARQVHPTYGRAAAIESKNFGSPEGAKDTLSRTAELFGSVDICIDTRLLQIPQTPSNDPDLVQSLVSGIKEFSEQSMAFLQGRRKGRVLYLVNDSSLFVGKESDLEVQNQFLYWMRTKAKEAKAHNINVNALAVGVSEEYLLNNFPGTKSITEAKKQLKAPFSQVKLCDSVEISNIVAFLVSPLSSAINGQVIAANHGLDIL